MNPLPLLVAAALGAGLPPAGSPGRRYAIVVGENTGDSGEETLRWAEDDARRVLQVFQEIGAVAPGDSVALLGANAGDLERALAALQDRLAREAGPADQLVIYVSCHADEGDLHLAGTRFALHGLTEFVKRVPVGVAVLILDSCRSGSVTRLKGLKPIAAATAVSLETPDVLGRVIITSSGADEYAQESDSLRGSHFTHHLVAGLRGAADVSHDGLVTLQEAYAYAYVRTVESTFATRGGAQHPSFRLDLKGQGELVLTSPRTAQGRVLIDVARAGRWLIASDDGLAPVGQFDKAEGPALIAVPPGRYRLQVRGAEEIRSAAVSVPAGGEAVVREEDLAAEPMLLATAKGGAAPWELAVAASGGSALVAGPTVLFGAEVRLLRSLDSWLVNSVGGSVGYRLGYARGTPRFAENEAELRLGVGHQFALGSVRLRAAVEIGGALAYQTGLDPGTRLGLSPLAAIAGDLVVLVAGPFTVNLSAFVGGAAVRTDAGTHLALRAGGCLGVGLAL